VGSVINYWVSQWVGQPVLRRYGKYVLLPENKLLMAEDWIGEYGVAGVFAARLLPVVRHLISVPAGALRMPFMRFTVATLVGSGLWCGVLSWFGREVIGGHPELLQSPEAMVHVIKAKLIWFVAAVVGLAVLYAGVTWFKKRSESLRGSTSQV
jgi:membrane protein DedA with SNARE-associated domain